MEIRANHQGQNNDGNTVYLPDFFAKDVLDIDFKKLHSIGIKHVIFDLDQTLRQAYARRLEAEVITAIHQLQDSGMFHSVVIMSNNHLSLRHFQKALNNIPIFQPYWHGYRLIRKPNAKFFQKVLQAIGAKPHETVMIGDKLRADIVGANKAGMHTVLVKPRGTDYWFNMLLLARMRENRQYQKALRNHDKQK